MAKVKSNEVITDKCGGKKGKGKARDAKEYDMLLIDFIESDLKGESK